MPITKQAIIGTWRLCDWFNEAEDGTKTLPLGPDARGYINYSYDGWMFVHLIAADAPLNASENLFEPTPDEAAAIGKSHISYCGPFEVQENQVIHHVEVSSHPNWIGSKQVRNAHFDGDNLVLSADLNHPNGTTVRAVLRWQRVEGILN